MKENAMKRCANPKCPLPQPLKEAQFNLSATTDDGLQPYCRVCQSMRNSGNRQRKFIPRQPWTNNPELYNAYRRLRVKVRKGLVTRQPCEICGKTRVEAYLATPNSKPRWFCHFHHPRKSGDSYIAVENR